MLFKKKEKEEYIDDGRTVADMNIDGMPWYNPKKETGSSSEGDRYLTGNEKRAFIGGVLKATMLVVGIFVFVYFLFILFSVNIWFK